MDEQLETLLAFFKALADATRLKIVGYSPKRNRAWKNWPRCWQSVPPLFHITSRNWRRLDWSRPRRWLLQCLFIADEVLEGMAQKLLSAKTLPAVAQDVDRKAYDRQVLDIYLAEDGTLNKIPGNRRKLDVVLNTLRRNLSLTGCIPRRRSMR